MNFYNWTLEFCTLLLELGTSQLLIYFTLLSTSLLTTLILIDLQTLAKWFGFRHFVHIFPFAGHSPLRCCRERPYWKQDFCTVFLFMYSYVSSLLFWFDFNSLIFFLLSFRLYLQRLFILLYVFNLVNTFAVLKQHPFVPQLPQIIFLC